jgi:hypothetical protein
VLASLALLGLVLGGTPSSRCPASFPYAFHDDGVGGAGSTAAMAGGLCCATRVDCFGSALTERSTCCMDDMEVKCAAPPCADAVGGAGSESAGASTGGAADRGGAAATVATTAATAATTAAAAAAAAAPTLRERLVAFYTAHKPSRLPAVSRNLEAYAALGEARLWRDLGRVYGEAAVRPHRDGGGGDGAAAEDGASERASAAAGAAATATASATAEAVAAAAVAGADEPAGSSSSSAATTEESTTAAKPAANASPPSMDAAEPSEPPTAAAASGASGRDGPERVVVGMEVVEA